MSCPACNAEMPADAAFCPKCGHRLAEAAPAASVTSPSAPQATGATPAERLRGVPPAGGAPAEPETELWRGRYSPKAMYGGWLLAAVVTVVAMVAAVLLPHPATWVGAAVVVSLAWLTVLVTLAVRRASVEYIVTNQRLLHHAGLLARRSNRIMIIDVDDVSYEQGPIERMFGVGTIKILSSDVSDPRLVMTGVEGVQEVANLIDNARREERRKRAVYMETV